jgi:hypothetical protein
MFNDRCFTVYRPALVGYERCIRALVLFGDIQ